jgi:hypothetical protein
MRQAFKLQKVHRSLHDHAEFARHVTFFMTARMTTVVTLNALCGVTRFWGPTT